MKNNISRGTYVPSPMALPPPSSIKLNDMIDSLKEAHYKIIKAEELQIRLDYSSKINGVNYRFIDNLKALLKNNEEISEEVLSKHLEIRDKELKEFGKEFVNNIEMFYKKYPNYDDPS